MKLEFYKTGFAMGKNGVYEDVGAYLASIGWSLRFEDVKTFGYFGLNEVVRLPMPVTSSPEDFGDYCVATDDDGKAYMYYVTNASWRAKETVQIELAMDTLTTFWDDVKKHIASGTHITRRTKPRWIPYDLSQTVLYPEVDAFAEPFQVQMIQRGEKDVADHNALFNRKWYVVWSSKVYDIKQSTDSSISIQPSSYALIPDGAVPYRMAASNYSTLTASNIPCGNTGWFAFTDAMNHGRQFTVTFTYRPLETSTATTTMVRTFVVSSNQWYVVAKSETGNLILQIRSTNSSWGVQIGEGVDAKLDDVDYFETYLTSIRFDSVNEIYRQTGTYPWMSTAYEYASLVYTNPLNVNLEPTEGSLIAFKEWYDRNGTDESIVKIVEYPYCPIELDNNGIELLLNTTEHSVGDGLLVLKPNVIWKREIRIDETLPGVGTLTKGEVSLSSQRNAKYETKLLNSNYGGYYSFSYDASSWVCRPELIGRIGREAQKLTISMLIAPQSGGVAFVFDSNQYRASGDDFFIQSQRDNTLPTYNSEYINYLKYGNAIEQKKLVQSGLQGALSGVSAGLGAATTVAMAVGKGAAAGASGGPAAAIAGAAVGLTTAAINIAVSNAQQRDSIERTKLQGANSAARASCANDVEIYDNLGLQTLKLRSYVPVTGQASLLDFFHRFGYATDEYGLFPTNSRHYFDYVQCEVQWSSPFQWKDRMDDMAERLKQGATIYHRVDGSGYDLNQWHENWEEDVIAWAAQ